MFHFRTFLFRRLDQIRLQLANPDALVWLSILAVATGILTGLIIVAFRFVLDYSQTNLLPSGKVDDYESLPSIARFLLPCAAGLLVGLLFQAMEPRNRSVGIVHVIERLQYHQGRMNWRNMVMQFVGASISIVGGHSVGREGPSVHMGGYSGSWLAQRLRLPNNSTRTLVACGSAAAIGASFNTPLAGIIFAMEVILQQYSVQGFVPVILAAVSSTYLSIHLYGEELFFTINLSKIHTENDWMLVVMLGIGIGVLSSIFNYSVLKISRATVNWQVWVRFTVAGFLMGIIAFLVPEAMGTGYDTVHQTLNAHFGLSLLIVILLAKFIASMICSGLGLPGGMIGPLMFIGSVAGAGIVSVLYNADTPFLIPEEPEVFALLGMGAMFSASLQAPLAGLTAVMELSSSADIILPAMLAIVSSNLTNKVIFHHDSIFLGILKARGLDHSANPVIQRLRMIGAASVMNRSFYQCQETISPKFATMMLNWGKQWIMIVNDDQKPQQILRALDLQSYLETHPDIEEIHLNEIPGNRLQVAPLSVRASLQEAADALKTPSVEALYLHQEQGSNVYGIITRDRIERAYQ